MGIPPILLGMLVVSVYAFLWIGIPILLTTWVRKQREEAIRLQIALTDAIHWEFGQKRTVRSAPETTPSAAASSQATIDSSSVVIRPLSSQRPDSPVQSTDQLNWYRMRGSPSPLTLPLPSRGGEGEVGGYFGTTCRSMKLRTWRLIGYGSSPLGPNHFS